MKKKIVVFHPIIAPYRIDLFNALAGRYDADVVLFRRNMKSQTFDYSKIEEQFSFKPYYMIKDELGLFKWVRSIIKMLLNCKPDIVFVNEYGICTIVVLFFKIITRRNYRIINIVDDSYDMVANNNHFTKRHKIAMNLLTPKIDEIINVEPRVTSWYQKKFGKGLYFPIICDDTKARERQKKVLPISENYVNQYSLVGKKVMLFVGRLVSLKNIEFAIDCFIHANISNAVFVIVGDGPDMGRIRSYATDFPNVIITGRLEGNDLYAWYNIANVLVLSSIQEPFGAVTNEALVAGCKVLVSEKAGSNCLVKDGDNGYVINPFDKHDFSIKLKRIFEKTEPVSLPLYLRANQMCEGFDVCINRLFDRIDKI